MSLFRVIREEDLNINKIFHTILVEINKYENNVDLRKLGCKNYSNSLLRMKGVYYQFFIYVSFSIAYYVLLIYSLDSLLG